MHDIRLVVEKIDFYKENLSKRNFDTNCVDQLVSVNDERKSLINLVEVKRSEVKKLSKKIGPMKKAGEDATELMAMVASLKKEIETSELKLTLCENCVLMKFRIYCKALVFYHFIIFFICIFK